MSPDFAVEQLIKLLHPDLPVSRKIEIRETTRAAFEAGDDVVSGPPAEWQFRPPPRDALWRRPRPDCNIVAGQPRSSQRRCKNGDWLASCAERLGFPNALRNFLLGACSCSCSFRASRTSESASSPLCLISLSISWISSFIKFVFRAHSDLFSHEHLEGHFLELAGPAGMDKHGLVKGHFAQPVRVTLVIFKLER